MSEAVSSAGSQDEVAEVEPAKERARVTLPGALDSSADKEQQDDDKYFKPAVIALVSIIVVSLLIALYYVLTG